MKRWPTKRLQDVAELFGGSTPSRDTPAFWNGDIHWLTPTDLPTQEEGISVVTRTKDRITQAGFDNSSATLVPKGTVLFSSRATIGKVAVAGVPLTTNQGFANFVPREGVSSRFLAYSLWHRRQDIARLSGSTTFKEVSRSTLRRYEIPVPPLAEQEWIVKLLDEAAELRKLRAQADRRMAQFIPALFHEMFGDPATNPRGFPKEPLGDLIHVKSGESLPAKEMDSRGTFPVYGGNGVSGHHDKWMFEQPVIVIGRVGVYCGVVHFSQPKSWVTDNALYVCQLKRRFDLEYLAAALRVANLNQYAGRAAQPLVSGNRIYPVPILVPPLALQHTFAQRVGDIREMEAAQAISRRRLDDLFQSMLQRAFSQQL